MLQLDQSVLYMIIKSLCYSLSFCVSIPYTSCPYNKNPIYRQMHSRLSNVISTRSIHYHHFMYCVVWEILKCLKYEMILFAVASKTQLFEQPVIDISSL